MVRKSAYLWILSPLALIWPASAVAVGQDVTSGSPVAISYAGDMPPAYFTYEYEFVLSAGNRKKRPFGPNVTYTLDLAKRQFRCRKRLALIVYY